MLTLYTTYYQNLNSAVNPIAISNSVPKGIQKKYNLPKYEPLMPPWNLVFSLKNNIVDWPQFRQEYNNQLSKLDPHLVIRDLLELVGVNDVVTLVCYEKDKTKCHRTLAAEWLTARVDPVVKIEL